MNNSQNNQLVLQDDFTSKVKRWVLLDSQLKIINEKAKSIREEKNDLNLAICDYLQKTGNSHRKIMIHDGDLKMHEKKDYSPLTFTFLEEHLGKIINDPNQIQDVIMYLKQKREIKIMNEIKRTYKNNK